MSVQFQFDNKKFLSLVKRTGLNYSEIERDLLKRYDVLITSVTIQIYSGLSSQKIRSPQVDKLAVLAQYFTDVLGDQVRVDDFYDLITQQIKV